MFNHCVLKSLKVDIFLISDPMSILTCSKGSYLWKSSMEGKKIVEKEAFWRLGNGHKIDVWKDP